MTGPRPDVAEAVRQAGAAYLHQYGAVTSTQQRRVLRDLAICRTAALGGHKARCDRCGYEQIAYNSCRNRHCPQCQAAARAAWLDARQQELLPVPYFHVVFTLPDALGLLTYQNPRRLYALLFHAAATALLRLGRDPHHLGARLGFLMVLHTWGQTLQFHPHVHVVVAGGGLSPDGTRWVPCRPGFLLPVRVLSRLFRGIFLRGLHRHFEADTLRLHAATAPLARPAAWRAWCRTLRTQEWVVYAKPPFGGPKQVLKYLARYTHRVAIANQRLVALDDRTVSFRWKDYAAGNHERIMQLDAVEFIRRFLLHVLPTRLVRIRYYGFLSNGQRTHTLMRLRQLVPVPSATPSSAPESVPESVSAQRQDAEGAPCPHCQQGRLRWVETLPPAPQARSSPAWPDTS